MLGRVKYGDGKVFALEEVKKISIALASCFENDTYCPATNRVDIPIAVFVLENNFKFISGLTNQEKIVFLPVTKPTFVNAFMIWINDEFYKGYMLDNGTKALRPTDNEIGFEINSLTIECDEVCDV